MVLSNKKYEIIEHKEIKKLAVKKNLFFTTFFGTRLSISGDQFCHVLIGPSGTISVFTFYLVLKRSNKKFT